MITRPPAEAERRSFAVDLPLAHGRPGAHARLELLERRGARLAVVQLAGWLDPVAVGRLDRVLDELAGRGLQTLLVDCGHVRHIDYRSVPALAGVLARFGHRVAGVVVCGLSPYLRDLFRLAGCDSELRCGPPAAELLDDTLALEPSRERAS